MISDHDDHPDAFRPRLDLGFDPDALRARYRAERDKRLRADANDQYVNVTGGFAHYLEDPYVAPGFTRAPLTDEVEVIVIGGGFGGLLAGARLRQAGFEDIRLIEKGGDFGGTWYWNRYPGAMCDVESYIYLPLLEEVGYVPKEKYTHAPEILAHSAAIGRKFDLYRNACFQTEVTEMRWDEESARWIVSTNRGDRMKARFVVMSNGPLNRPKLPGHPGHRDVQGPLVPHQPLGLRLHRRELGREPHRPARQARGRDRHRRDRRAVRAARRRDRGAPVRVPAHAVVDRRAREPRHRSGLGGLARGRAGTSTGWTTSTSSCRAASRKRTW